MLHAYKTWKSWNFKFLKLKKSSKVVEFEALNLKPERFWIPLGFIIFETLKIQYPKIYNTLKSSNATNIETLKSWNR
jgi:hypothetical protein